MAEKKREIPGPSSSQNKITHGDPTSRLENDNMQDSGTLLDRSTLFQFKTPQNSYEVRRTIELVTELRDLFDKLDDYMGRMKRHQAHMGTASDEKTKKMIRLSMKNAVRNISYVSNSISLKNNTNKVFKAELLSATNSIIDHLKNEQTSKDALLSNLDNLRDYIDESLVTTETQTTGKPPRMSSRMVRKSMMNRRNFMRQIMRRSKVTSKTKRPILSEKVIDKENTINSFEDIRTALESIAMSITEKSQNQTPESEGKIKTDIKKALRKLQDINTSNPDMKKVDSAFRSNLTTIAELMIDYLPDKDPSDEKLCDIETLMYNLLDMIEEGETDLPEVDLSPKKNPNPDENVRSKVFKDTNLPEAKTVVFEIKREMNILLDVLRYHDYSDEKIKRSRRGVKQLLKTIKELSSNAQVMDALSDQLRELLAKATEQMVFYLTDEEDNIDLLRDKIQKVFVMLNEVENPEVDQNIESSMETQISKESLNFNDNESTKPEVEMAPNRSLEDIMASDILNSGALLAESVASEHAGDAPMNAKQLPENFHKRKIESEIKQNEKSKQEPIKNRIGFLEVEHPQKLQTLLSQEVPGPSGLISQSNNSGNTKGSSQATDTFNNLPSFHPSIISVPNVPEHFKLPGPSGSKTEVSSVPLEEKVSQHTQTAMNVEPIKAPTPPVETVETSVGNSHINLRDQSSETDIVEKITRATITQITSPIMNETKSVQCNDSSCEEQSAGNKEIIKDIDRLRSDLDLIMQIVKETNQLIKSPDYRPRASNSDVAVNTIPMISAGLEVLQKNNLILDGMTPVGINGPEDFEKHPELPPEISNKAGPSMHTSGFASQRKEISKGNKIQRVGAKTKLKKCSKTKSMFSNFKVSKYFSSKIFSLYFLRSLLGWLPKPAKRLAKRRKSNLKPPDEPDNLAHNDGIDTSPDDENEITDELKFPPVQQVENETNNGPEPKRIRTIETRSTTLENKYQRSF